MPGSVFDSQMFAKLFPTGNAARLFSDTADVRAMMLIEGTLAKVQGQMGLIPEISAAAIHRASLELQIDPGGLAQATGQNGVTVPALVAEFRKLMQAPEYAQYLHFGATSQDIMDTSLMLRLRQYLGLIEADLKTHVSQLGQLAAEHKTSLFVARTYSQDATITSFGAVIATWGNALCDLLAELPALKSGSLWVSLSGAAGTGAAFGPEITELRANFAQALGLGDPKRSWHSDRAPIARILAWLSRLSNALAKMAEDLLVCAQSNLGTVSIGQGGGSSTMPQKQNPVLQSAILALNSNANGLYATLTNTSHPKESRDGVAWFTEWMCLPQFCLSIASALEHAMTLSANITLCPDRIEAQLQQTQGMIFAEALSFELARIMPRPDAQDAVKTLCKACLSDGRNLLAAAATQWPDLDQSALRASALLGEAPKFAADFHTYAKSVTD